MDRDLIFQRASGLGATLYMPAINPHAKRVFSGEDLHGAGSVVICLEDALHENDIERGLAGLKASLKLRKELGDLPQRTMVFIRPRNIGMAHLITEMEGFETVTGLIVPKMSLANGPGWLGLAKDRNTLVMPTLETAEYFDSGYTAAVGDMFTSEGADRIMAVRLGGNDLLNVLGLRRVPGVTAQEGPLGYVLSMMSSQLMARGLPVAAPVYDVIHDHETLAREVGMDVARGFIGKTAIHPCQVPIIHQALKVSRDAVEMAQAILDDRAGAVFQIRGVMCEPATHRGWARRTMARARTWGVVDEVTALQASKEDREVAIAI
ncbi:HpcH/HpaI aldolase/citrate lyase family protein [Epibacterium sp. DP7N7-1]|nr:HpcH/HpaI aldolase/citrate lyase family protein [Epibacterium sp. DP7N7-1]